MIPTTLTAWTADLVRRLLGDGVFESEVFDFKERLPHPQDARAKERLRAACAAFANAEGGFLVFGVADDRTQSPDARLVGVEGEGDFPAQFGDYPRSCSPSVQWQFRNPPIQLQNGRVLHVVHIPQSGNAPHAVGNADEKWVFPKRTNRGTEGMNIQEIRASFLGLYEKRLKLQLLKSELQALRQSAGGAAVVDPERVTTFVSLASFELQVIESVLADTYSITAGEHELHLLLAQIRQNARLCNVKLQLIRSVVYTPLVGRDQLIREHNLSLRTIAQNLCNQCDQAITLLERFLTT